MQYSGCGERRGLVSTFMLDVLARDRLIRYYAHAIFLEKYNIGYFPLSCIEDRWGKKGGNKDRNEGKDRER